MGASDVDYQLQLMQNLSPYAGGAVSDVELASRWLKQSYTGLQQLQQDLGNRGRIIANAENRTDLADSFASAARPQTYTGPGTMELLGDLALIPGLTGAVASAVRAVLDLKDGHFLAAVQDGLGAIPGERLFGGSARLADEAGRGLGDAGRGLSETERGLDEALSATAADRTLPTGNPGDVPTGQPRIDANDKDPANIQAIQRQNESAATLANQGYRVEQEPPPKPNGKRPDYRIEGRYFDCYAPTSPRSRNIASEIQDRKVDAGQADRIVLNLDGSPTVSVEDMRQQLANYPIPGLKEVIALKGGVITHIYP